MSGGVRFDADRCDTVAHRRDGGLRAGKASRPERDHLYFREGGVQGKRREERDGRRERNDDATVIDRAEETPPGNRAMVKVHVCGSSLILFDPPRVSRETTRRGEKYRQIGLLYGK